VTEILRDLAPQALIDAIQENEVHFHLYHARTRGWEIGEDARLTWYMSGRHDPFANGVLRTRFAPESVDDEITAALDRFRARGLPMVWWMGPARQPANLGARLEAHDLANQGDDPGLAADLHTLNEDLPKPSNLTIERVTDEATLRTWVATKEGAEAGADPDAIAAYRPASYADDEPARHYLARLGDVPVAVSELVLAAGVAGIYCVATVPAARRQGIGAAVTLAALRDARARGYRVGVLGSTQEGLRVYQNLGFQIYCQLGMYIWEP
jgi:ribosomal protein S18 acetylase RimI-like enzyme